MLSPYELLESRKKPPPDVISLGQKSMELVGSPSELFNLEMKLSNIQELLSMRRVKMMGILSKAEWRPELKLAEVITKVGSCWEVFGHTLNSKLYLYPEEALYLLEIGSLEIRFNDVPLSIQRAHSLLEETAGLDPKTYRVFSHLSLLGYKVIRHSQKNVLTTYEKSIDIHKIGLKHQDVISKGDKSDMHKIDSEHQNYAVDTPENKFPIKYDPGDSTKTILSRLRIFEPSTEPIKVQETLPPLNYDVFIPTSTKTTFRKSVVQLPDYRIRIMSNEDNVPCVNEIYSIHNSFEDKVPIVYAIVHPDFISYFRIEPVLLPIIT